MSKVKKGIRTEPLEERMEEMKTYTVGIIAVAMLLVGTGAGFGIAQMEGTCTDRPVLSFEDQELPKWQNRWQRTCNWRAPWKPVDCLRRAIRNTAFPLS
jgi:hypothetical protein